MSCFAVTTFSLYLGVFWFAWCMSIASFTCFLLLGMFHATSFISMLLSTPHVLFLGAVSSRSGGPLARKCFRSPIIPSLSASVSMGFLARFAPPAIGSEVLVAISVILLVLSICSVSYGIIVSRGSPYSHSSSDAFGHVERSRMPVVRAADVENGVASAADLAWQRRAWLAIMRARTRQLVTRHWALPAFRRRTLSGLILAPRESAKRNDLRYVVERVIWIKEAEIFRLVVSYL